jgi:hypothetical protein
MPHLPLCGETHFYEGALRGPSVEPNKSKEEEPKKLTGRRVFGRLGRSCKYFEDFRPKPDKITNCSLHLIFLA